MMISRIENCVEERRKNNKVSLCAKLVDAVIAAKDGSAKFWHANQVLFIFIMYFPKHFKILLVLVKHGIFL